jgi:metal-responsive CopG/Arc/MetJ family transcriptional regulator
MNHAQTLREKVRAHHERQIAAGHVKMTVYLPGDLIKRIDRMKEERGLSGRAPLIEEALRLLIEK